MAIPDYQSIMLPLMRFVEDGAEHSIREAITELGSVFNLSDEERNELLPSGRQSTFDNRVGWARTYLNKAGLLERTRRSNFRITERGRRVLASNPSRIDVKLLDQFPEFNEFRSKGAERDKAEEIQDPDSRETPSELLESAYQKLRENLAAELLAAVKGCEPAFFEQLVVDLLVKMGYGGSRREAGKAIGRSGDEGIDGFINEDRLGLDVIYVQAKRWKDGTVGRGEIQKFAGALLGQRARKGIFITTSAFTREAVDYVAKIDSKIILIDGEHLAQLMIDHGIGVSTVATYETKRLDSDFFGDGSL